MRVREFPTNELGKSCIIMPGSPGTGLRLFVNAQISTIFIITDREKTPILIFECKHESNRDIHDAIWSLKDRIFSQLDALYDRKERQSRVYQEAHPEEELNISQMLWMDRVT